MSTFTIGAATVNLTPMAWSSNGITVRKALRELAHRGAQIAILPELSLSGYGCEDMLLSPELHARTHAMALEIAQEFPNLVTCVGIPFVYQGKVYNGVAVLYQGKIQGITAKRHLAGEGIHYEPRWFTPWPAHTVATIECNNAAVPVGDIIYDLGSTILGFEICEDAWVTPRVAVDLEKRGCTLIANPCASHFAFGKFTTRRNLAVTGSAHAVYVQANLLGCEAGRAIYDGALIIAERGEALAEGPWCTFHEYEVITATVHAAPRVKTITNGKRESWGEQTSAGYGIVTLPLSTQPATQITTPKPFIAQLDSNQEFSLVVPLALYDYGRKSRAQGFTLALSGGADSTACALLLALMVRRALQELGEAELRRSFGISSSALTEREICNHLITTAYLPSPQSSETTRNAAQVVADVIQARHHVADLSAIISHYVALGATPLQREMTWQRDDLALQNIQARARSPYIWMIANNERKLLITTSNRSEGSVGYCTMDGDTSGGLAPIAGVSKDFIRSWLRWMEHTGPTWYKRTPELSLVTQQAPTAELRPQSAHQTDEADLMPYDLLDLIEKFAIQDRVSPLTTYRSLKELRPDISPTLLKSSICKFYRMWATSQWKRERLAPSFHLDSRSVDPRGWCRYPILNGGYLDEIAELEKLT
jgi:NAD+ synthase (glutamine-hydrolysing)